MVVVGGKFSIQAFFPLLYMIDFTISIKAIMGVGGGGGGPLGEVKNGPNYNSNSWPISSERFGDGREIALQCFCASAPIRKAELSSCPFTV